MPVFTLENLETAVLDRVDNALLYTVPEADDEINDAIRTLNLYTGFLQASIQVPGFSVINQFLYAVPTGILFPLRVFFNGRQLQKTSLRKLSLTNRDWLRQTSTTNPVQNWVPIGISTFAIHPADARGGQDIRVSGIAEPTPLVLPDDPITMEDEYAECVVDMAASVLQIKEGGKIFSDASQLYIKFLGKMKERTVWQKLAMPRYFVKMAQSRTAEEVKAA